MAWTTATKGRALNDSNKYLFNIAHEVMTAINEREDYLSITQTTFYYNESDRKVSPSVADMSGMRITKLGDNIDLARTALGTITLEGALGPSAFSSLYTDIDDVLDDAGYASWEVNKYVANSTIWKQFQEVLDLLIIYIHKVDPWTLDGGVYKLQIDRYSSTDTNANIETSWDNARNQTPEDTITNQLITEGAAKPRWQISKSGDYTTLLVRRVDLYDFDLTGLVGEVVGTSFKAGYRSQVLDQDVNFEFLEDTRTVTSGSPLVNTVITCNNNGDGGLTVGSTNKPTFEVTSTPPANAPFTGVGVGTTGFAELGLINTSQSARDIVLSITLRNYFTYG